MLLATRTVHVPAQPEIDADLAEYGHIGTALRAQYGEAACEAGDADQGADGPETSATDTIANVLHYAVSQGVDVDAVMRRALDHFHAETEGETQ